MQFNVTQEQKLEALASRLQTVLDAHGIGTFNVHKFVTAAFLDLKSKYDFRNIFGSPVRWCRIAPIDQIKRPEGIDEVLDVGNATVLLSHTYEVIIQIEFTESDVYTGSTQEAFNKLLWGTAPAGVLVDLSSIGAFILAGTDQIIQVEAPDTIAIPSFPVAAFGSQNDVMVHHCDFRVTLT